MEGRRKTDLRDRALFCLFEAFWQIFVFPFGKSEWVSGGFSGEVGATVGRLTYMADGEWDEGGRRKFTGLVTCTGGASLLMSPFLSLCARDREVLCWV